MSQIETPNRYQGTDAQRIQQAVDAAAVGCGRVSIPRENLAAQSKLWLLDEAIRLPSNMLVELEGCRLKLSDRCRDNFFRSANCGLGISPIEASENIHLVGKGGAVLEGADRPRATGDAAKTLGEQTYGTDAGVENESQRSDWRNIGILMASVSNFSIQNIHIVDSHSWAISLEYCSQGTLRDLSFDSRGSKTVDGKKETILNQDGIDLREGCNDILIENISGQTGDDLVALTAIANTDRKAGSMAAHMVSGGSRSTLPGIHNVIIRNVRGHCAGGHHIVRLLNTGGLPMENILIDGLIDTSHAPNQSRAALKIGDKVERYGGINPLGSTRRVMVNNIISRAKYSVLIGGSLCDSSFTNILQNGGDFDPIYFESGAENVRNVVVYNARTLS